MSRRFIYRRTSFVRDDFIYKVRERHCVPRDYYRRIYHRWRRRSKEAAR
jgi:hypothetical protein